MKRFFLYLFLFSAIIPLLHSCSLLKVSADLGVKPLATQELNARVAVRMFATNFTDIVSNSADTIFIKSNSDSIKLASIRWKRNASSACMNTSLNSIPEGAIVNTWILVKGMDNIMWSDYFGIYGNIATHTSDFLLSKYKSVISNFMSASKFSKMEHFVDSLSLKSPLDIRFKVKDYSYEWFKYSGVPDSLFVTTVGSISEVIADLNDRVGKYSVNVSNQLEWGKEQLEYQLNTALADSTYKAGLDSLNNTLSILKIAVRNAPDKVDSLIADVNMQIERMIGKIDYTVNSTMNNAFGQFATERQAFQEYASKERMAIMADGKVMIDDTLQNISVTVYKLIRNLLIYFLIFVFLLIGIPFYVGYRVGHSRKTKRLK